jgi:hypothetical protein
MSERSEGTVHSGGCLCGAVRYRIIGTPRQIVACHCSQCLKTHGHYAAYTAVDNDAIEIEGVDKVTWYDSSQSARRGFCSICGGRLFWQRTDGDYIAVAAGTLDVPTGLKLVSHIFVADKPDYYELTDGLKTRPQGYGSEWPERDGTS